jgi:hypothetical protein
MDVEGSLFVTRNINSPIYTLIVLNKKGPKDFVFDISRILKMQNQDAFLMFFCKMTAEVSLLLLCAALFSPLCVVVLLLSLACLAVSQFKSITRGS